MPDPKLVAGTLYLNRDRDYRSGEWGPYVKIGIVRNAREAQERIREHQTGNPRQVICLREFQAPMVESLETQIHHRFSEYWTSGEWFCLDPTAVDKRLVPEIEGLVAEQNHALSDLQEKARQKQIESNGVCSPPSQQDLTELEALKETERVLALAKLDRDLAELRLRIALGSHRSIEGIIQRVERQISPKFDSIAFRDVHPDIWSEHLRIAKTKPKGSLRFRSRITLATLAPEKSALKRELMSQSKMLSAQKLVPEQLSRTEETKRLHERFIRCLGPLAKAEWALNCRKAAFAARLGSNEGIEGVCTWKRRVEMRSELDEPSLRTANPALYRQFLSEPRTTISLKVNFHRPYPV